MIRTVLLYAVLGAMIYGIDALLTDVIGNFVLRMLAAAAITAVGVTGGVIAYYAARERWRRAS